MSQPFLRLKAKLEELFQLDRPELDFGVYRIMHARSAEISSFLEKDLLPQVREAFAQYRAADRTEIQKELQQALEQAVSLGADPETLPKVKALRERLTNAVDVGGLEVEVYDHLYNFFRRYYSDGDFLSHRVYRQGVYAIPYEGEEVKLHWANSDQYYIKTDEYLRDYTFLLRPDDPADKMRVHFKLVDAAEGEHGTVKEVEGKNRVFVLAPGDFVTEDMSSGVSELVVRFEYRPTTPADWDAGQAGSAAKPPAQKDLNPINEGRILSALTGPMIRWADALGPRLSGHLSKYAARNTFDYFIHKDLGGFLRRELDFYIKNEVMHLDDVESESVPRVEQYLSKIKVIRRIAGKIITFLAQLEDFQKRLWLKKKFVTETFWCIRLGCIPEEFYPEIAASEAQREDWVRMFAIDRIARTLTTPGFNAPLTLDFLKAYPTLVVDTRHFADSFCARLLEAMGSVDGQVDSLLLHSENFQALSLMRQRFREQVKCIYIDPPYNTGSDGFAYKDSYQHSTWHAMIDDRLGAGRALLSRSGVMFSSIDDIERSALTTLCDHHFGVDGRIGSLVWKGATDNNPTRIAVEHEYLLCYAKCKGDLEEHWSNSTSDVKDFMLAEFDRICGECDSLQKRQAAFEAFAAANRDKLGDLYRYRRVDTRGPYAARRNMENPGKPGYQYDVYHPITKKACTKPYWGWRFPEARMSQFLVEERVIFGEDETKIPELKVYLRDVRFPLRSVFSLDARKGSNDLDRLFGRRDVFRNPKPVEVILQFLPFASEADSLVVDFFAGSGTTGHAIINLNREDGGRRQFMLVDLGVHFDTVLLPRLKKVTFSPEWKDGGPARFPSADEADRAPRIVKVIRLESYEDALNNLDLRRSDPQQSLLDAPEAAGPDGLREQYVLKYMLDVEARGSQSLLNVTGFLDPRAYRLKVKRPGSDETREVNVDLLETFNYLVGLTVDHMAAPQTFSAAFTRDDDPDLPKDAPRRLLLDGRLREEPNGTWWFRSVTGTTPEGQKALVIWRNRPGGESTEGVEQDNLVLDAWFQKQRYSAKDSEFDVIWVNGDNNLENLKVTDDNETARWKVRLIEVDFHRLMFEMDDD